MNSTTSSVSTGTVGTVEAHASPVRVLHQAVEPTVSRSTLADRLALRLGMALVIWSRQHGARSDARRLALALRLAREERRAGQYADERRAMAGLPLR